MENAQNCNGTLNIQEFEGNECKNQAIRCV